MTEDLLKAIRALSVDERIALVEQICDTINADCEDSELDSDVQAELDRRIQEMEADPGRGLTLDEFKDWLRETKGLPTAAQQAELERRLSAIDAEPGRGSTWEDVKQRLRMRTRP